MLIFFANLFLTERGCRAGSGQVGRTEEGLRRPLPVALSSALLLAVALPVSRLLGLCQHHALAGLCAALPDAGKCWTKEEIISNLAMRAIIKVGKPLLKCSMISNAPFSEPFSLWKTFIFKTKLQFILKKNRKQNYVCLIYRHLV